MDTFAFALALGGLFTLGFLHAFGPDHLAAITSLSGAASSTRRITLTSIRFALGHTGVLLAAGLAAAALGYLPSEGTIRIAETVGGLALVILGAAMLHSLLAHRGEKHSPILNHPMLYGGLLAVSGTRSFVLAIPVTATAQHLVAPVLFAMAFGLGIVVGMAGFGILLGMGKERLVPSSRAAFAANLAVAAVTMTIGLYWSVAEWV